MGMFGEAGGIKYDEMSDQLQDVVDQKAETYEDKNVQVVDTLSYGGEQHEDVAVAYVGDGTVPQVLYDNVDLEEDSQMVMAGNVAAASIDHAMQNLDEEGVPQYVVMEAGTGEPVSEEVQSMRPLGAVNDASDYFQSQEFNDRLEAHMNELNQSLNTSEAREFVSETYQDMIESAPAEDDPLSLQREAMERLNERAGKADEEVLEDVNNAVEEGDIRMETVFADSMRDHSTVSMTDRMNI